ncbi:MAG TPA: hypothetical protein VGL15_13765 [Vicinamibacteria bacterium]|jgi:hypothetical protein
MTHRSWQCSCFTPGQRIQRSSHARTNRARRRDSCPPHNRHPRLRIGIAVVLAVIIVVLASGGATKIVDKKP